MSRLLLSRVMPVIWLVLSLPVESSAQPEALEQYVFTSWTHQDGLPASWISAIVQDRQGYLWLGTKDGLIRFDGLRFVRIDVSQGMPLPNRSIVSLCAARDGSIWVGSAVHGVSRIGRDGRVRHFSAQDGFSGRRVRGLIEDRHGAIWASSRSGLFRFQNDRWERIGVEHGIPEGPVYTVYESSPGALWVGTARGVFSRAGNQDNFHLVDPSLVQFPAFHEDADGVIWRTDPLLGAARLTSAGRPSSVPLTDREGVGVAVLGDSRGTLWVATYGQGLWSIQRSQAGLTVDAITVRSGLLSDTVLSLLEDAEGSVWVGTAAGLHKLSPRRVTSVSDLGLVRGIVSEPNGRIWVATADGLVRIADGERRRFATTDGLSSDNVRALHVDNGGRLWVATERGVASFVNGRFMKLPLAAGRWPNRIMAIAPDRLGNVWLADQDYGLFRWSAGQLTSVSPSGEVDHLSIDSVAADRSGRVWLSIAGGGIGVFGPDGAFRLLRRSDALNLTDLAVYEDAAGAVWFGGGSRLSRVDADGLVSVDLRDGAGGFPGIILAIVDDDLGNLWIGTTAGILRLARKEFESAVAAPAHRLEFKHYDSSDGLVDLPVQIGYRNAVRDVAGTLWFVTGRGLTRIDPRHVVASPPAPNVRIDNVVLDGRSVAAGERIEVPPRTDTLHIEYSAISFLSPASVQFRYWLEGIDDRWIEAGTRRHATYSRMPPGQYAFRVVARNKEGIWNEEGALLTLLVRPAVYQTSWFLPVCAGAIGLAVWIVWRLRVRHLHRQFSMVLAERGRLGREIHDTLLQSLVGVAMRLDVVRQSVDSTPSAAKEHLAALEKQLEHHIREARESVWNLRSGSLEQRDLVIALRDSAQRTIDGTAVDFKLIVSGDTAAVPPHVADQLVRIAQEALTNVVRHSDATTVMTELVCDAKQLVLRVTDDGRGFDSGDPADPSDKHCGLLIMAERAAQIRGSLHVHSRPGSGTQVEVVVRAPSARRGGHAGGHASHPSTLC